MGQIQLKHLQPAQYESWLRKAEDPEWNGEEFGCSTRSKSERAAASLALELRDHLAAMAAKDEQIRQLREALRLTYEALDEMADYHGASHEGDCPEDDTCNCLLKPFNDRVGTACEAAMLALEAK